MTPDDRAEWLTWRAHGLGASDIAGVLGISPWSSRYSVWLSKMDGGSGGTSGNVEAMRWGTLLEDAIATEAARRLDMRVSHPQTRCVYDAWPMARATVDGFYAANDGTDSGVFESKTTSEARWHIVPEYYEAQVQWQLMVTGELHAWIACLHNGRHLSLWRVESDPEVQAAMLDIGRNFWTRYVETRQPPEVDGMPGTTDAIRRRYATPDPDVVVELDGLAGAIDELRDVRAELAEIEARRDRLENMVKDAIGNRGEFGTIGGDVVASWRKQLSKRIDTALLREKYPEIAEECTTETSSRRFILRKAVDHAIA